MKVKELISKLNCESTLPVRMKESISDPGVILAWNIKNVFRGANCKVLSFQVNQDEMIIYYDPIGK